MSARKIKGIGFIKPRTQGTSNEVTFSVLDAKSAAEPLKAKSRPWNKTQKGQGGPQTVNKLGKVALFTTPGTNSVTDGASSAKRVPSGTRGWRSTVSSGEGVRRGVVLGAIAAVVALAAVAAFATGTFNRLGVFGAGSQPATVAAQADNASQPAEKPSQAALIAETLEQIQSTDEAILALDQALSHESVLDAAALEDVQGQVRLAKLALGEASTKAAQAFERAPEDAQVRAAENMVDTIAARTLMLETGEMLLRQDVGAVEALSSAREAWEYVLAGDAQAREAALLASAEGASAVDLRASKQASEVAAEYFAQALALFQEAKSSYPPADWANMLEYVQLRITASTAAAAGDDALSSRDNAGADANTANANEAEDQAALLAAGFPEDPTQPILDAYTAQQQDHVATYEHARMQAAAADSQLRDYLAGQGLAE